MAGGFGMYARNFLAGQGRYIPDTQEKAPAASEGEDGAVCPACKMPRRDAGLRPIEMCACATLTYTRPAAQAAFTEADGVALRSIKVGEVLTQEQWDSICAFVREGEAVLDARNNRIAELAAQAADESSASLKHDEGQVKCHHCGAPCREEVLMRGGDNGWGDDASRTVRRYAPPAALAAQPAARRVTGEDLERALAVFCASGFAGGCPVNKQQAYPHHPGASAANCQHREQINVRRPSAATSSGYACLLTGGHCRPGSLNECPKKY